MHSLDALCAPRGAVVLGASANPEKLGAVMGRALTDSPVPTALVNGRGGPGMHATVADAVESLPAGADLAVLCVPAAATARALRDCAAAGVSAALVCAGGFAEAGGEGHAHDREVMRAVRETGIRLLGPNTSGFFVPATGLRASFVPGVAELEPGSVAVVAASGGVNHVLAYLLRDAGVGVSLGVGIGAGADISAPEVLDYLIADERTAAVALHVETVADGPALVDAVRRLSAVKPVAALVVGKNDVSEFAQSHTGALATSWRATRAVLRQAGAVLVDDERQLVAAVTALAGRRLSPNAAPGVGLITGQAGPGLLIADALHSAGAELPRLGAAARETIASILPPLTYQDNPVDTGRPGPGYDRIIAAVAEDPEIDVVAVYGITEPVTDLAGAVAASGATATVSAVIGADGPRPDVDHARGSARAAGVPLLSGPSAVADGVAALVADARARALEASGAAPEVTWPDIDGPWDEARSKDLLSLLGIATPHRRRCATRAEAHQSLAEIGGSVAVKLLDAAVLHKTEIGGVHLGIGSPHALDSALDALEAVGASAFLVEEMAAPGIDLVLGARRDPVFGPIVLVGIGGIAAEIYEDVAIRSAPLSAEAAAAMVDELRAAALLDGFRGGPTLDARELGRIISTVGGALCANDRIEDIEINPLRLTRDGLVALDAVVISVKEDSE